MSQLGRWGQLATGGGGRGAAFILCTEQPPGKRLAPRTEVEKPDLEGRECRLSLLYTV